jgi:hypothetical protein
MRSLLDVCRIGTIQFDTRNCKGMYRVGEKQELYGIQ